MPQKTNLNVSPYYDDFDARKDFYKVLFRPGYSIQSRELITLQSILQNQIESYGKHQFKQGDLVVPGEVGLNTKLDYVKLSSVSEVAVNVNGEIVFQKYDIKDLVGETLQGVNSGVIAKVLAAEYATETESDTIYVKYVTSGNSSDEPTFRQGETLEVVDGVNTPLLVVGTDGSVFPTTINVYNPDTEESSFIESPAMGYASAVKVEEGIYFVNGYFVRNEEQLLVIDKYYDKPSTNVGFGIEESIVTPEEDASLYDNAKGFSNSTAPGAHRLSISLNLKKISFGNTTEKNFIQLITVKNGEIQRQIKKSDYTLLENTLARRTYDESGDYVVDNFSLEVREYYQKNGNLGVYQRDADGLINGLTEEEANSKMIASVGPGKAYVKGFEILNNETKYLEISKARDTLTRDNVTLKTKGLSQYNITNLYGSVPLNDEGADATAYPTLYLNTVFNDGTIGLSGTEASLDRKQTLSRRGSGFGIGEGIKTIYIYVTNSTTTLASINDLTFETLLGEIWFIKSRINATPSTVDSARSLSFSKVKIKDYDADAFLLELTVVGDKDLLQNFLLNYDEQGGGKLRDIFLSRADALANTNKFGHVVYYTDTITPVIGVAKPKNLIFKKRGEGFNQDTDIVLSKGKLADGTDTYNSIFGLNYFNPEFFTRLLLDSTTPADNITAQKFSPGQYITGLTSGAYAVIEGTLTESYSIGNILFVKSLFGTFVPGESIVDENGNILRIAKENTISHFIVQNRGQGYVDPEILIDGVKYDNSKVNISTESGTIYKIDIVERDAVSTQYSRPPVITFKTVDDPVIECRVTPVLFRNPVLTYTPQNVKSFYAEYGAQKNVFTADVESNDAQYTDTISVTDFTFTGVANTNFIECNGFNGDATIQIIEGDVIVFADDEGVTSKYVVQYATKPEGTKKSRIYLSSVLHANATNVSVIRVRAKVSNTDSSLLFPTGSKQVSSLIYNTEDTKFRYYTRRDFITYGTSSGNNLTFAAQLNFGTQRFVNFTEENFVVTVLDKGASTVVQNGDILYINPSYVNTETSTDSTSGLTAGSVTITLPNNFFGNINSNFPKLKLTATIEVSKAKPRLKTANTNKRIIVTSAGDKVIPLRGQDYDTEDVNVYSYSDAYKLLYVYEGSSTVPPKVDTNGNLISGTDVTNRFTFDDGQRDTYYDISRIVLKPGYDAPQGQLVIGFHYFEHSQGDFCTVDSYLHEAGVGFGDIPSFNSSVYGKISLRDVVDFRPKADADTIISGYQDTSLLSQENYIKFNGQNGVVAGTPAYDTNIEYTMSFTESQYLDRIDGVFLDKAGNFIVKEGNSSLNPSKPEKLEDAIALYYIHIPSYTNTSKDVKITPVDNRRYTMRDIGKLEKRIERLEYYTTLSILEQQALNMQIKDEIGLDRFKSGFIVDNFESHRVGNLASIDYKCSIDTQQSTLRPQVKEDSFNLKEVYTRSDQRSNAHYTVSNGVVTLPYSDIKLLGNNSATKTINPNPFVVLQYVGDANISPSVDQWYNTDVAPLVTDNNTKLYSIYLAKDDNRDASSAFYNSFIVNWVGTNRNFYNIGSFSEINSDVSSATVQLASVASSSNISPFNNEIAKGVSTKTNGDNVTSSSLQFFARSIPVKYNITRLKPNTQFYVFMEGVNVNRWAIPDIRYTGIGGNSPSTFNAPIVTDENGNASGILLIPAGAPPKENTTWSGNAQTLIYDETSAEVYVTCGIKTIRFTTSANDANKDTVDSYTEVKYYCSGTLPQNPQSIISTIPSQFKANEGVQLVDNVTANKEKPNPLSQTFKIENYPGGVFVTGLDLFFNKKSTDIPIRTYLTNVDIGKPGKYIVPGTESVLLPNTYIRVYASGTLSLKLGENITGRNSGATGPLLKVLDKNNIEVLPNSNNEVSLNNEQIFTLVLSNHNGSTFLQNEILDIQSLILYNATTAQNLTVTIAKDSGKLVDLKVTHVGSNYTSAIVTIESPQQPGGSTATATVDVSNGKIFNAELSITGSGYTEPPSVVIRGTGTGASGAVIESVIEIDTPAVRMGVAVDFEGQTQSITPTHFRFKHPVYLQNDSEYAMVVETDSTEYQLWASRLSETEVATGLTVTTQPLLGSVYKSQNTDNWIEDLFEDIKFNLYRAEFNTSRSGELLLTNENLGYERMEVDPVETYAFANTNATSNLFKNNNSIVKIRQRDNGFEGTGKSYVFFKSLDTVGGITSGDINSALYQVINNGIDFYSIVGPNRASANSIGGGSNGLSTYNRKYERLFAQISYLQVPNTKLDTYVKTTNIVPVDSNTRNYISYSQTNFEKTFLNEEHFFTNQKVIASRINQIMNNIDNSLVYKVDLSSDVSYLSPVVDLRVASVKTSTNRIENAQGQENRFGKRYQQLKFFPVYRIEIAGNETISEQEIPIELNQTVEGTLTGARASVLKYVNGVMWVKVLSPSTFAPGEILFFSTQSQTGGTLDADSYDVTITQNGITSVPLSFEVGTSVVAFNPSDVTEKYDNKISGKIINWDSSSGILTLENDKQPLENDYTSKITVGSAFSRNPSTAEQSPDIFRVGDIIFYNEIPQNEEKYTEVSEMTFSNGVDFVLDTASKNSSSVAKYVTKEVAINNPGTSIDVRLTLNIKDIENVKVLYRSKETSSQVNFDDIEWKLFNGTGVPDDADVLASAENTISAQAETQSSYQELKYSASALPEFTSFAIKIVMKSSDPSYVPKIQDIRAVASY